MDNDMWSAILMQIAWQIPYLIVCLVGIVLALMNWTRKPAAAMLTVCALLLLLVTSITGAFTSMLPMVLLRRGWAHSQMGVLLGTLGMIHILLVTGGVGLLLAAIFRRDTRSDSMPGQAELPSKY